LALLVPALNLNEQKALNLNLKLGQVYPVFFAWDGTFTGASGTKTGDGGAITYYTFSYIAPSYTALVALEWGYDLNASFNAYWIVSFSATPTLADTTLLTQPADEGNVVASVLAYPGDVAVNSQGFASNFSKNFYPSVFPIRTNETLYAHLVGNNPGAGSGLDVHLTLYLLQTGRGDI